MDKETDWEQAVRKEAHRYFEVLVREKARKTTLPMSKCREFAFDWLSLQTGRSMDSIEDLLFFDLYKVIAVCKPHAEKISNLNGHQKQ